MQDAEPIATPPKPDAPLWVEVVVDVPLFGALTYRSSGPLASKLLPGQLVLAPFRNRAKTGLVLATSHKPPADSELAMKARDLLDLLDPEPVLDERGLALLRFVADYYLSPIGEVMKWAIPSSLRLESTKCYVRVEGAEAPAELDFELGAALDLCGPDPVPIEALRGAADGLTYLRLAELEERGLVRAEYIEDRDVSAATEHYYRLGDARAELGRLGGKQLAILALFADAEAELGRAEIRRAIANPHASLRSLVGRGALIVEEREVYRDPFASEPVPPRAHVKLSAHQERAVGAIRAASEAGEFRGFLLHGATGSGKTEVYARAIRAELDAGRTALILLPEIALTPQFVAVFRAHFGDQIAVLHSGLTRAEKFDQWRRIRRREVSIVIGARSAIFAPLSDLGLIVVDEEHDPSFKQQEGTRYHARDMAIVRATLEGARVVLGSATPSLESIERARSGRLELLSMPERVADRPLPEVELLDLRHGARAAGGTHDGTLTRALTEALGAALGRGEQAIVFLNRRGFAPCIVCSECGHLWMCPNCDVSLTYHRFQEALRCHHCDHAVRVPEHCPSCGALGPTGKGVGTEQLAKNLASIYPGARIARLDRDTATGARLRSTLAAVRAGQIDLLVGTQMVTKGHDFPNVTVVGVVLADLSLNFPDFRAAERTFQLLTQVAGRAGRGDRPGKVYVQTLNPEHYALTTARTHDFSAFAERELEVRREWGYPPYGHLIALKFEAVSEPAAQGAARAYALAARRAMRAMSAERAGEEVLLLGPALAPLARLKNRYRWQILLKSTSRAAVRELTRRALARVGYLDSAGATHKNVRVLIDVDPISLL